MSTDPSSHDMFRAARDGSRKLNIGIVGAGFAGLRCADILMKHGVQVSIFEARDRLGGRVAQSDSLGHSVDLGANWIHGSEDNPILKLAKQTETRLSNVAENHILFDPKGDRIDAEEAVEYAEIQWDDGLIAEAFKHSNENGKQIDANQSLHDFYVEKSAGLFQSLPKDQAKARRERFMQYASIWGEYVGSSWTRQSLKFFWLEETINGENPFVAGTYAKILEAVAQPAKNEATIHLNTQITTIRQCKSDSDSTSLRTSNGKDYEFDAIVVTCPLGWLQKNKSAFVPPLEPRLVQAIDSIGYGNLDKVLITFPTAFWQAKNMERVDKQEKDGSFSDPNTSKPAEPTGQTDDFTTADEMAFAQWLAPSYSSQNPEHWSQQCMNLAALPGASSRPTLLFYIYGDCGAHIGSIVKNATSPAAADEELISFFRPYFARLPGYVAESADCQPQAVLATAWVNDEFAGYGSYTNYQIGLERGDEDIEVMRHGMPEQGLWLAGEHTSPFIAMGTTTGAYWSGERVAERILDHFSLGRADYAEVKK